MPSKLCGNGRPRDRRPAASASLADSPSTGAVHVEEADIVVERERHRLNPRAAGKTRSKPQHRQKRERDHGDAGFQNSSYKSPFAALLVQQADRNLRNGNI